MMDPTSTPVPEPEPKDYTDYEDEDGLVHHDGPPEAK
jgi:hypothetical protein